MLLFVNQVDMKQELNCSFNQIVSGYNDFFLNYL